MTTAVPDAPAWAQPREGVCRYCRELIDAYASKFVHRESLQFACLQCADSNAIKRGPVWARYSDG